MQSASGITWKQAGISLLLWLAGGLLLRWWLGDWGIFLTLATLLVLMFRDIHTRRVWLWEALAALTLLGFVVQA